MAGQASRKVRPVRCPQCLKVLEEPPDVPLYSCGGCGNILQAKNWKPGSDRIESSTKKNQEADVFEEKEIGSLDRVSTRPPSLESSSDKDIAICPEGHKESDAVLCEKRSVPDAESSLLEDVAYSNRGSFVEGKEPLKQGDLGVQIFVECNSEFCDDNDESTGGSSNGVPSPGKYTHGDEVCVLESIEHIEQHNRGHSHEDSKGDRIADDVRNFPDLEDPECIRPSDSEQEVRNKHNSVPPESNEKGWISGGGIELTEEEQTFEADDMAGGFPITTISEKKMNVDCGDSFVTSQKPLNESLATCYLMRPADKCSQREHACVFGRVDSMDTLGSLARADLISEINTEHESMTNHPMAGGYYMYDGSESSYAGNHDHIGAHTASRTRRYIGDLWTTEMLRQDAIRATEVTCGSERNHRTSSWHRATRSSHWGREKYAEATGYASENNLRRDPLTGCRAVGLSRNRRNLLPLNPGLTSSSKMLYSKLDKMDLLRTVYELKDQLSRMQLPNKAMRTRRLPDSDGRFDPFSYSHLAAEREAYTDLNCRDTYLQHDQAKIYRGKYSISRMASLGEASRHRHHVSCSCSHCCPPSELCYLEQSRVQKRSGLQEKRRVVKRYVGPVVGAAPFIRCYHCSKLLQLPADFLIFKKRKHHQLMCNACKNVLRFLVIRGTHIVPYVPKPSATLHRLANQCSRNVEQGYRTGLIQTVGSVGSSSRINKWRKSTSEIKEFQPSSNHRLHQLMGYSSVSQALDK